MFAASLPSSSETYVIDHDDTAESPPGSAGRERAATAYGCFCPLPIPPVFQTKASASVLSATGSTRASGAANQGTLQGELRAALDEFREELLGEVRKELQNLTASLQDTNKYASVGVDKLTGNLDAMSHEFQALREQLDHRTTSVLRKLATGICGGDSPKPRRQPSTTQRLPSAAPQFPAPWPPAPGSGVIAPPASVGDSLGPPPPAPPPPSPPPPAQGPSPSGGLLGPVNRSWRAALFRSPGAGLGAEAAEVHRVPFIDGLEAYAELLNKMGGNMGSYISTNTKKLRRSKADASINFYRAWLLSELPVHAANSYKEYVDESAWMANLWIGRILEFFVEMFAGIHDGQETGPSVDVAYKKTLSKHHNFFQRAAFQTAVKQLPPRKAMLKALAGGEQAAQVSTDLGLFVDLGRPLACYCLQLDAELAVRMQAQRKASFKR